MNMNRDRPTSEKSQRTGDTGGIRQSMSFYHLLREIQPTVKDKYSVITFVLTVVGSILCFLPFYAYMILANNDNGQGGISNMSGLNLDTSIDYSVSMKNSVSSGNQDTDSALFHAINRYCSMLLVLTYSLITLFCYTLSHTSPSHITTSNKHQCLSVCLSVWLCPIISVYPILSVSFHEALLLSAIITIPMLVDILLDAYYVFWFKSGRKLSWVVRLLLLGSLTAPSLLLLAPWQSTFTGAFCLSAFLTHT